ncbi:MAG: hypothetical protein WC977_05655 [Anaerovoracaceae bacterium]
MGGLIEDVLDALKKRYIEINGLKPFDTAMVSEKGRYYLADLNDNLIIPMKDKHRLEFSKGAGHELKYKMRALRSSSAMAFNLIGNGTVEIIDNNFFSKGMYTVDYEKAYNTIKQSSRKAHLDAYLYSKDNKEAIFCEMKMLEWLESPGRLSCSYLDEKKYNYSESYPVFLSVFDKIISTKTDKGYKSIFKSYDAFQILKHSMSIYNAFRENKMPETRKATLVNCIWELCSTERLSEKTIKKYKNKYDVHNREFDEFRAAFEPIIVLFKEIGIEFEVILLPFHEFVGTISKTNAEREKLERYYL